MSASTPNDAWTDLIPAWASEPLVADAIGPVMCLDHRLRFLYVNPLAETALGVAAKELLGTTFPSRHENEFYRRCDVLLRRVLESGEEERIEFGVDGGSHHYWCRVAPTAAPDGSTNLVVVARDVTETRRTSKALGESAARTRSLLRTIPDMVFRIRRDGTYLDYFPGIGITPVAPPGEFLGRKVPEVITEDFAPGVAERIMSLIAAALDSGDVHTMEYVFKLPDSDADYEGRVARCGDDDVMLVVRDISDRKRAERQAARTTAWWQTLAENVPALITAADVDGRIQYLNNPVPPMTRETVVGTSLYDYVDGEHEKMVRDMIARVKTTRTTEMFEVEADPGGRWYESHIAAIITDDEVTGVIIMSVDITERRQLEHELAAVRDNIEDKVEAAHDGANQYGLSFRELTVLALVAEGKSDKEIAAVLGLRPRTVSKHVEKIFRKMRCSSRTEAGVRAIREKLVL